MLKVTEREPGREKEQDLDPVQRFKVAQREFIKVAGRFDLDPDPDAKLRTAGAWRRMSSAAEEISKDTGLMEQAERAGIVGQIKSLIRERHSLSKERNFELER